MPDNNTLAVELPGVRSVSYQGKDYKGAEIRELLERLDLSERAEVVCTRNDGSTFSLAVLDANTGDEAVSISEDEETVLF